MLKALLTAALLASSANTIEISPKSAPVVQKTKAPAPEKPAKPDLAAERQEFREKAGQLATVMAEGLKVKASVKAIYFAASHNPGGAIILVLQLDDKELALFFYRAADRSYTILTEDFVSEDRIGPDGKEL